MLKVYGIHGQTTAIIKIPFNGGRGHVECEFKRGVIGRGPNNRPATYATSDKALQGIIEDSPYFGHLITIVRVSDDGTDSKPEPKAETPAGPVVTAYPDVTERDEAVAFLKAHGAKATNLKDDEAIKKYMAKINVSFPNLSL